MRVDSTGLADLGRFAQEFRDEAHLRSVLQDLLIRMNARGVRITHGTNERGKDIIFYKAGGLTGDVLYACVVKKERITGKADSNTGAQTVLNQAIQALNEPYIDQATGKQEKVHSVYIICPYDCTPGAVESIAHQLREQAQRIQFICGIDLLELFQTHWPDFLRFESAVLTRYLTSLSAGLSVDNALIALLTRHNANLGLKPFESFYVPNNLQIRVDAFEAPRTPLPWQTALDQHRTWEEVQETVSRLRFWRQALRSSELTGEPTSTLKELFDFVAEFVKNSRRYWDQGLKTKRTRKLDNDPNRKAASIKHIKIQESAVTSRLEKPREDEERQLAVPEEVRSKYARCYSIFDRVNQQLIRIQKASGAIRAAVAKLQRPTQLLADERFCSTSAAYDYVNASPGLIRQTAHQILPIDAEALFSSCRAVLVSGPPGSGKTSFCRWQTLRAIERFSTDRTQPLPIYVPAHRLAASEFRVFEDAFFGGDVKELWPREDQRLSIPIRLFVDGLDELPDREQQRRVIGALKEGLDRYQRLVVIVTSRPYVWGSWLNWLPRVHMAELGFSEQRLLAERWLGEFVQVEAFFHQLAGSPALQKLMGTPLLATLILNLYRKTPKIPENKASLYRAFVDLYSGGWDVAKGLYKTGHFGNEQKMRPLPGLAYRMHLSDHTECTESKFVQAVGDTMPALVPRAGDLLTEVIQDGILVRVGGNLMFAHLSFQEYLAAQYLASDPIGNRPAHALRSFLRGEDWWKEVLEFYLISRDDPATLDDWIERTASGIDKSARGGDEGEGDSVFNRLEKLANVITESFPGYQPRFSRDDA